MKLENYVPPGPSVVGTGTGTGPCGTGPGPGVRDLGVPMVGTLLSAVPVVVLVVYPVHLLRLLLVMDFRAPLMVVPVLREHEVLTLVNGLGDFLFGLRASSLPVSLLQLALAARHPSPWVTPRRPVPRCLWFTRFFGTQTQSLTYYTREHYPPREKRPLVRIPMTKVTPLVPRSK